MRRMSFGTRRERLKHMPWSKFLKTHWDGLAATDFFAVEVWTKVGLVRHLVLFVIELKTRRVDTCRVFFPVRPVLVVVPNIGEFGPAWIDTHQMHHHYLPKFLLRRFADQDGLWQFDIHTGNLERRSPENAGQRRHFYSVELETGLLQRIDSEAGAIFARELVDNNGHVLVTAQERQQLARWLALFVMRSPELFENFKSHVESAAKNPDEIVSLIYDDKERCIQDLAESIPDLYEMAIEELGQADGEAFLLEAVARNVRRGKINCLPSPKDAFVAYINDDRMNKFAALLLRFQWVWLRTRDAFIIGDNPLCRWSKRMSKWNYGLNHKDVVVTIPMSRFLCLRLQRAQCRANGAVPCDTQTTRKYNARQMLSSVYNVYGPQNVLRTMTKNVVTEALAAGKLEELPRFAP